MSLLHAFRLASSVVRAKLHHATRSPRWRHLEQDWLSLNPYCSACLTRKHVQVHHVRPVHVAPALELDRSNLISLCMDTKECHLRVGHLGNWRRYNPLVRRDAQELRLKVGA